MLKGTEVFPCWPERKEIFVSWSVQATITDVGYVAYKQKKIISRSSGSWTSQIRVSAWLDSGESSISGV